MDLPLSADNLFRVKRLLPCLCIPRWQLARPKAPWMLVSKCNGYFRSRNNFITGSSICRYSLLSPMPMSNFDDSTQSTYNVTILSWNKNASERMVDVSLKPGISKCFEWVIECAPMSSVIFVCLRSKKNENLCFNDGKSSINNASTGIWNFRRGLLAIRHSPCKERKRCRGLVRNLVWFFFFFNILGSHSVVNTWEKHYAVARQRAIKLVAVE